MTINRVTRPPLIRTLFSGSIRNGFDVGYRMAMRSYGSYRVRITPVVPPPSTNEQAEAYVKMEHAAMKASGWFLPGNALRIAVSAEGKFNGHPGSGGLRSGAGEPLKASIEEQMIELRAELMRNEAPGAVHIEVNYIDCEEKAPDGRKIGETRGFVIESGTGTVLRFGKKTQSDQDGWVTDLFSVRAKDGPQYVTFKDTSGDGRHVIMRIEICLDALLRKVNPFAGDILFISGAGIPPGAIKDIPLGTDVVTADQTGASVAALLAGVRRTTYEVPRWPRLRRLHNAGFVDTVSAIHSALTYFGVSSASLDEKVVKLSVERAREIRVDGIKFMDLAERTLPPVGRDTPKRFAEVVGAGADFIDKPAGTIVVPIPSSPEEQVLAELAEDLKGSPDPGWQTPDEPETLDPFAPDDPFGDPDGEVGPGDWSEPRK